MERKIGETFEFEGKKIEVKAASNGECDGCILDGICTRSNQAIAGKCEGDEREDRTSVKFVEVQEQPQKTEEIKERKVGEVFEYEGHKLKVVADADGRKCPKCFFYSRDCSLIRDVTGFCLKEKRIDRKSVTFVEVNDEQPQEQDEQPQELNLCEVLKYCPQGETFWSPMLNGVKFSDIDDERQMIIVETVEGHFTWEINHDGTISIDEVTSPEVMLFPSKEQRDWTKVKYEKKKELPRTWEEFCKNYPRKKGEAYSDIGSQICICEQDSDYRDKETDKNLLPSREAAEAHLAYKQLHQLRDAWREGWLPDWKEDTQDKYAICNLDGEYSIRVHYTYRHFLVFQDEKRADEFLECYRDLIMKAGDLI